MHLSISATQGRPHPCTSGYFDINQANAVIDPATNVFGLNGASRRWGSLLSLNFSAGLFEEPPRWIELLRGIGLSLDSAEAFPAAIGTTEICKVDPVEDRARG